LIHGQQRILGRPGMNHDEPVEFNPEARGCRRIETTLLIDHDENLALAASAPGQEQGER
jgi:hypothetical protein